MKPKSSKAIGIHLRVPQAAACSAVALLLAASPVTFDLGTMTVDYQQAVAKSCFIAGTKVRLADGSLRAIEDIRIGDQVLGMNGRANRVVGIEKVLLENRLLYGFNESPAFVTAEHPFLTPAGWKSIDPSMTALENAALKAQLLGIGDVLYQWSARNAQSTQSGHLPVAQVLEPRLDLIELKAMTYRFAAPDTIVFNLLLDGDNTYFANDYLVHNKGGDSGNSGEGGDSGNSGEGGDSGNSGEGGDSGNSGEGGDSGNSGEGGDSGNSGEGGDSGNSGEGGDSGNSGEGGDSGNSGEGGDSGNSGEGGDSGGSGEGGGSSGSSGSGNSGGSGEGGDSGDSGDDSGESGESGDDSGESGESGDDSGESGESSENEDDSTDDNSASNATPAQPQAMARPSTVPRSSFPRDIMEGSRALTPSEEAEAIANGWQ